MKTENTNSILRRLYNSTGVPNSFRSKCICLCLSITVIFLFLYLNNYISHGKSQIKHLVPDITSNMTGDSSFNNLHFKHLKRRLPQCIIIGVRKAGTRALLGFLNLHPQIVASNDEVHFFDRDENYRNGLEWYTSQMPYSLPGQITIEKTPAYFHSPNVVQRMHDMNSSLRLILIVRDPVIRAISDWYQLDLKRLNTGKPSLPLEKLVLNEDDSINSSYEVLQRSLYFMHYRRWTKLFSQSQIHIVDGEAFIRNPSQELELVEAFLKIPRLLTPDKFVYNEQKGFYCVLRRGEGGEKCLGDMKGRKHPPVDPTVLKRLRSYFSKFNNRFYRATDTNFNWK